MFGQYQNAVDDLPSLDNFRYENIFKISQTGDKNFYFYNIIKTISVPDDIDSNLYETITVPQNLPLTSLSYDIYGTQHLWWLIMIVNKIDNPMQLAKRGVALKIIKPSYVNDVIDSILTQLQ